MKNNYYGAEIVVFPGAQKSEISGPMTMSAEAFKENLRAAFLSGFELSKGKAAMVLAETPYHEERGVANILFMMAEKIRAINPPSP